VVWWCFRAPSLATGFSAVSGENFLWTPAIHVLEKEDNLLSVRTPRREWRRLGISVIGGKLIVQREKRRAESEVKKERFSYIETLTGSSLSLVNHIPSIVDSNDIYTIQSRRSRKSIWPKMVDVQPRKEINVMAKKEQKLVGRKTRTVSQCAKSTRPKIVARPTKEGQCDSKIKKQV